MQQLRVICYPSDTPCFSKLTRIQPGTFSYDIFSGQYVTLYAVSKKYFTESKKTLQIKAGQNGVSVNQCFSLYCYFFFQTSAFFVSKSAFRQASFEENKTFFSSKLFFHSKWPDLTGKRQELGPAILWQGKSRCKNGNVQHIRSKWREVMEVVQYCRYWPNSV